MVKIKNLSRKKKIVFILGVLWLYGIMSMATYMEAKEPKVNFDFIECMPIR